MVKGKSKKQFPCGDCKKACESGCLLCEAAKIGLEKLKASVERESLLSDERYCCFENAEHNSLPVDAVAADILFRYHAEKGIPLRTTGDGDCLFNAVSILLCGSESKSIELGYKTTLMMVLEESAILGHTNRSSIQLLSPDYSDAVLESTQIGSFSSVWTMIALAMATKRPLRSVYPGVNGTKDLAFMALNTTFNHAGGSTISVTSDMLVVHRAYSKHKNSLKYMRRATWIGNVPHSMTLSKSVSIMEYVGVFPGGHFMGIH